MPIVAEQYPFVIGVDTHAARHAFAVIDARNGAVVDQREFPVTGAGLSRAVDWAARRVPSPDQSLVAVEGIGSYGAAVARAFARAGHDVVEAGAQQRAEFRGKGKSDELDAVRIARSVLGTPVDALRIPRADGARNALRILIASRALITREATAAVNALTALVRTEDLGLDARRALTLAQLRQVAAWRARQGEAIDIATARAEATRLARQVLELRNQAKDNERRLRELVLQVAPGVLALPGVGPITAAIVIVAWSHRGRVRSEAAFAALAGTCPIPASSGNTVRHRLNRGGDRRLNYAIHTIVMVRMGRDQRTKDYVARRISEGKTKKEAMRCLKRHLTKTLHRTLMQEPALAA
jgi:transposase